MIYGIIIEGLPDYVKIGKTGGTPRTNNFRSVMSRLSGMQTSVPMAMRCIALADGYTQEERALHRLFSVSRVMLPGARWTEWFHRTADVNEWLESHAIDQASLWAKARARPRKRRTYRAPQRFVAPVPIVPAVLEPPSRRRIDVPFAGLDIIETARAAQRKAVEAAEAHELAQVSCGIGRWAKRA